VADQLSTQIAENIKTCRASSSAPERRLRDLVLRHVTFVQRVPALPDIMVMRHAIGSHQIIRLQLQKEMSHLFAEMVDQINLAQDKQVLRANFAAQDIATLIMGIMQGLALRMIISRDPSKLIADAERLFDLQIETLAPRGPTS
jgi:AcrR family transcriptional regulator